MHFLVLAMNKGVTIQTGFESIGRSLSSQRLGICISIVWAASLLLASWLLSSWLGTIRDFEFSSEFEAHNHLHWFRPIAFFWFDRFSLLPSIGLAVFICARHAFSRDRGIITWILMLLTVFLLAVGIYTVWEHLAVMHQFVL